MFRFKYHSFVFLFLFAFPALAQVTVKNFPKDLQFVERTSGDMGFIEFDIYIGPTKPDRIYIYRQDNNGLSFTIYTTQPDSLHIRLSLTAGLTEFSFYLREETAGKVTTIAKAEKILCGDAFLFYGQSNALALGQTGELNTASIKKWTRNFVGSSSGTNGWRSGDFPEIGTFGKQLCLRLIDSLQVPVMIINGAKGGLPLRALYDRNADNPRDAGTNYGNLLARALNSGIRKWRGFVWYQGEEESAGEQENIENYPALFDSFKKSVEQDFQEIDRFYVFQLNIMSVHQQWLAGQFREYQRQFAHRYDNVSVIPSLGVSSPFFDGIHYEKTAFGVFADRLYLSLLNTTYSTERIVQREAAQIRKIIHFDATKTLKLVFDSGQSLSFQNKSLWPNASLLQENGFYQNRETGFVSSANTTGNILELKYKQLTGNTLTYLPGFVQESGKISFDGPLLFNELGIPAFSFSNFPIKPALPAPHLNYFEFNDSVVTLGIDESPYSNCQSCEIEMYINELSTDPKQIKGINAQRFNLSKEVLPSADSDNFYIHLKVVSDSSESPVLTLFITDTDKDGYYDQEDNCPLVFNPYQEDFDGDGLGDVCDEDNDGDGIKNEDDDCPFYVNPPKPLIRTDNGYQLNVQTSLNLDWFENGSLLSEKSDLLTVKNSGQYTVRQKDAKGCYSELSEAVQVTLLGLAEGESLSLYPNPAVENVRIEHPGISRGYIRIFSGTGQESILQHFENEEITDLTLSGLSAGVYYVLVESADGSGSWVRKLQKIR